MKIISRNSVWRTFFNSAYNCVKHKLVYETPQSFLYFCFYLQIQSVMSMAVKSEDMTDPESSKRKRPNIISQRQSSKRKRPNIISQRNRQSTSSQFDQTGDQIAVTKKERIIKCRFCGKKYRHLKARNKHLISDHFEECRQVQLTLNFLRNTVYSKRLKSECSDFGAFENGLVPKQFRFQTIGLKLI